jgi:ribosomal-protein-alanine N-acetyltransferase
MSRVLIRHPQMADQDAFIAAMRESRELHGRWVAMAATPSAYATYIQRSEEPGRAFFLACRIGDGAIVGFLNLGEIIRGSLQQAFLGYGGTTQGAGQGYMTEAMHLVLRHAFTELRLHRIEANIQPGNLRSIALARRCGFELEGFSPKYLKINGRWRDHERWAIREDRWRATRPG